MCDIIRIVNISLKMYEEKNLLSINSIWKSWHTPFGSRNY